MPESMDDINIQHLAIIGDRRTCALPDRQGSIVWYCPQRFGNPSLFGPLLDTGKRGHWRLELHGLASLIGAVVDYKLAFKDYTG